MNITFITTMAGHSWGGSEELWLKLAYDALGAKHKVECSIFNWGKLPPKTKALQQAGAKIKQRTRFMYSALHQKPWGKLKELTIAQKQLSEHLKNRDFAFISMGGFCDLEVDVFRKPLLKTKTQFSLVVHANPENTYLNFNKITDIVRTCKKAHKIYFVSERLREIAIRQTGYNFPNSELIINPVNIRQLGILPYPESETVRFACVGELSAKVKGQAILLQCLGENEWKHRNWHLNIYGEGNDLNYFKLLVKNFGICNRVSFHGYVNNIRNDIWAKNHILLMPSYYEGMSLALIEALLSGRTAVVTDVGGNDEILRNDITGFISRGVNKSSFNQALNRAWKRRTEWKIMGEKAFEQASNYFHKSKNTKNITDVLANLN